MPMQAHNILPPAASVFPTDNLEALTVEPPPRGLITADPIPFDPIRKGWDKLLSHGWLMGQARLEFASMHPMAPS